MDAERAVGGRAPARGGALPGMFQCPFLARTAQDRGCHFRFFSFYTTFKLVACASLLLYFALAIQASIAADQRDVANCARCLANSQLPAQQAVLYEFGTCADEFFDYVHGDNLLAHNDDVSFYLQSQAGGLAFHAVFTFGVVSLLAAAFLALALGVDDAHLLDAHLLVLGFVAFTAGVVLLELSSAVWSLYRNADGCWVTPVTASFFLAQYALLYAFIALTLFTGYGGETCTLVTLLLTVGSLFAYAVMALVLGAENYYASGDRTPLAFSALIFVGALELPTFLFGLRFMGDLFGKGDLEDPLDFADMDDDHLA